MKAKPVFLYILGIGFLLFGNRDLWDELQESWKEEKRQQSLLDININIEKRFETQKLEYDSVSKKWRNPKYYFQVINLGSPNFKALKKGRTAIETDTDEDASDSQ